MTARVQLCNYLFQRAELSHEHSDNQHFLLFPPCFQKAFFPGSLKVMLAWNRVKCNLLQFLGTYLSIPSYYYIIFDIVTSDRNRGNNYQAGSQAQMDGQTGQFQCPGTQTKRAMMALYDGPVLLHWLTHKIPSYQTLQYLGIGFKHKPLNPFPNKPWFLHVCSTGLLKTLKEQEKLLVMSIFYPFGKRYAIFIKFEIVVCIFFQYGSIKFVVWERINPFPHNDTF